jgi:hypothetical protein
MEVIREEYENRVKTFNHQSNTDMLLSPVFWLKVASLVDTLRPVSLSLNFGEWETAQSRDHRAIDCHGHAHLELTIEAAIELAKTSSNMRGRTDPQEDYLTKDIAALEARILSTRFYRLEEKVNYLIVILRNSANCS